MKILLEGIPLDYTLENEKNLLNVVDSLEQWLNGQQQLLSSLKVDGKKVEIHDKTFLQNTSIDSIDKIELEALNSQEWAVNCLVSALNYINRFISSKKQLEGNFILRREEIIDGLKWIVEIILNTCKVLYIKVEEIFLGNAVLSEILSAINIRLIELESRKYDSKHFDETWMTSLIHDLKDLSQLVEKLIDRVLSSMDKTSDTYREHLRHTVEDLKQIIDSLYPGLEDIGTHLLSGKDKLAFEEITKIVGTLQNMIGTIDILKRTYDLDLNKIEVDGESVEVINKDFFELLENIYTAIDTQNSVMLSDLMEYELGDKLLKYKEILDKLMAFSKN